MALAVSATSPALAHNAGVRPRASSIHGRTVEIEINALGRDYEQAAGIRIADKSGEVNPVALAVMAPSILKYVGDHVAVFGRRSTLYAGTGNGQGSRHPRCGDDGVALSAGTATCAIA